MHADCDTIPFRELTVTLTEMCFRKFRPAVRASSDWRNFVGISEDLNVWIFFL
jgi:hypothetical protein